MRKIIALGIVIYTFMNCTISTCADTADTFIPEEYHEVIIEVAEEYCICPELVMAMIEAESSGNPDAYNKKYGCTGLMQINPKWHKERMERLGVTDLYNPYENVLTGCDYLAELFGKYQDIYAVLMAYNEGEYGGAVERAYDGDWSNYAKKIVARSEELERLHGK